MNSSSYTIFHTIKSNTNKELTTHTTTDFELHETRINEN